MINHARTLLLNVKAEDAIGGEYVDPKYVPVRLEGAHKVMHESLFPGEHTPTMRNERMGYYGGFLGVPEFHRFLIDLDPRISYEPQTGISSDYQPIGEFHALYSSFVAAVLTDFMSAFRSSGKYREQLSELQSIWTKSFRDQDRLTAGLFALVYATEERRNVR